MAAILMALSACAADGVAEPTASPTTATTPAQAPSSTTSADGGGEDTTPTVATAGPPLQVEGPAAPDFAFALADGSSFTLSDEQKPVYLVFWAEW